MFFDTLKHQQQQIPFISFLYRHSSRNQRAVIWYGAQYAAWKSAGLQSSGAGVPRARVTTLVAVDAKLASNYAIQNAGIVIDWRVVGRKFTRIELVVHTCFISIVENLCWYHYNYGAKATKCGKNANPSKNCMWMSKNE